MHSAGFAAIRSSTSGGANLDNNKVRGSSIPWPASCRDPRPDRRVPPLVKLVGHCKSWGRRRDRRPLIRICAWNGIDTVGREAILDLVPEVLGRALHGPARAGRLRRHGLAPAGPRARLPAGGLPVRGRAQDLDPCQHALVKRIVGGGRLVVVGDPHQAIYSFRGALTSSMETMATELAASHRGLVQFP